MSPVSSFLLSFVVPLVFKTGLFILAFRLRHHRVSLLNSFLIASAPILLSIIPIPLPAPMSVILGIGLALFILVQYTDVDLFPDGIPIVLGIEVITQLLMTFVAPQ